MFFFEQSALTTVTPDKFDEDQWVKEIQEILEKEGSEGEIKSPVIFGVPKSLMSSNPDSYTPHQVAIGPYHHLRPELYEMERYKVAAAKRNQKEKLQHLVHYLKENKLEVRAHYHRPLRFHDETLAWMMAVDASFLLEFLRVCNFDETGKKSLTKTPSLQAHFVDLSENKAVQNAILRDIIMVENQIPLLVMRKLLEFKFSSRDSADEKLLDMLTRLSKNLSPFEMILAKSLQKVAISDHLLDFLYRSIVPIEKVSSSSSSLSSSSAALNESDHDVEKGLEENETMSFVEPTQLKWPVDLMWRILSTVSKPLKVAARLPWGIITKIPIVKKFKEPVENVLKNGGEDESSSSNSNHIDKAPKQEEIAIPSVTQLVEAGVRFLPIHGGISSIKFDVRTLTFHIPVVKLDVNSEVVLRNLVAYEACVASGSLFLSRYTELMNGIIDTGLDAKFLCRRGIIDNHLKSEKEVADLWNGMSKSVRLTKVPLLDDVITDVNNFYKSRWKVKLGKFMKQYVFRSWKLLTFLAAIATLVLMCVQAFCEVYSCSRIFPIEALEPLTAD